MEIFLESSVEGVNNLVQECWVFFVSDISWNADTCLKLRSCPGLLLESKSQLYTSLLLSLPLSLYPLSPLLHPFSVESSCPTFTCGDPGKNISARIAVQVLPKFFSLSFNPLSIIKVVVQKEHLCLYIDIPNQSSYPEYSHFQPLMVTHWQPYMYCSLHVTIFDLEMNTFSTKFTWVS